MKRRRYSRYSRYSRSTRTKIYKLIVCLLVTLICMTLIDARVRPIIRTMAASQAKNIATHAINNAITDVLTQDGFSYNDLVTINKDGDGRVTSVMTDIVKMNVLKARISTRISERIAEVERRKIRIPTGTIIGGDLMSGRGPRITLYITLSSNAVTEIENHFDSAGINQTRHQILLNIKTAIYVIIPGFNTSTEVKTNMVIAETIIVGLVPDGYAHITGEGLKTIVADTPKTTQ